MQCTKEEFTKLMGYIRDQLLRQKQLVNTLGTVENGNKPVPINAVSEWAIMGMIDSITQEKFVADTAVKRERKKVVIDVEYKEAWDKFWALWPGTKSVPGTAFTSGAKMTGNEEKMYQKWREAIKNITIEQMYYAANCYLQWAYEDSKRNGRNELLSRNGLEPYLNQKLYMIYMIKKMPETLMERKVYQNAVDQ